MPIRPRNVVVTLAVAWLTVLRVLLVSVHQNQYDDGEASSYFSWLRVDRDDAMRSYVEKSWGLPQHSGRKETTASRDPHWVTLPPDFDPSTHNRTIDASSTLPGLFWEKRLWLLGVRLTRTNLSELSSSTATYALTVFGMPGDFHGRIKEGDIRCPANAWYNAENGTLLSYPDTHTKVKLFYSLFTDNERNRGNNSAILHPLEFLRSMSTDTNQNNNTLIWHGGSIPLGALGRVGPGSAKQEVALRVTLHAAFVDESDDKTLPILTVDIPLSTGIVGQAGPQIVSSTLQTTREAALCVAIYGGNTINYLPEFILHHIQLGFGPIVVGVVDAAIGSPTIQHARSYLRDFIDEGLVDISAMGLPSPLEPPLECEVNVRKEHFYNTCLYHAKGRSPYMGIWDIDEYWMPPTEVRVNNTLNNKNKRLPYWSNNQDHSLWEQSNYSTVLSVGQIMKYIQRYQEFHGCGESWCYHTFPSWTVWLRRRHGENGSARSDDFLPSRPGRISEDFELRSTEVDPFWAKSITRTQYSFMGGLHVPGSCRLPTTPPGTFVARKDAGWTSKPYHEENDQIVCRNLGVPEYGMMHHYYSLNRIRSIEKSGYRDDCLDDNEQPTSCVIDEYVHSFGATIRKQMEARANAVLFSESEGGDRTHI